jgi:hypothetical protein
MTSTTPQVGQSVQYIGSEGQPYAATILLTPETWDEGQGRYDQRPPEPGEVSLQAVRPSGRTYVRHYVPLEGSEAHAKLLGKASAPDTLGGLATGEDEPQAPAPAVRYWRPIP